MTKILFFFIFICIFPLSAQTLHLISVGATEDATIGEGCKVNMSRIDKKAIEISNTLSLKLKKYEIKGMQCTTDNIKAKLKQVSCENGDIIWFYYSGHGVNARGKYPKFLMSGSSLTLENVHNTLQAKKPRLLLTFADCCNFKSSWNRTTTRSEEKNDTYTKSENTMLKNNYKELFLKQEGSIILSSSEAGQYSLYNEDLGGLFTFSFFEALYQNTNVKNNADWEDILEDAKKSTENIVASFSKEQTPQFSIKLNPTATTNIAIQNDSTYIVKKGDGLWSVATASGVTYSEDWAIRMAKRNKLIKNPEGQFDIHSGMKLVIVK